MDHTALVLAFAQGKHPAAVLNTLISAVGVNATLGEVPDDVPQLIG